MGIFPYKRTNKSCNFIPYWVDMEIKPGALLGHIDSPADLRKLRAVTSGL
jgi:hypothetical protein